MKVIVASSQTQGELEGDYSWTLDGELVHLPVLECASPSRCGCGRGFCGVASHRATTTAEVAPRDLERAQVIDAVARSLAEGGWCHGANAREARALALSVVAPLLDLARRLPVGTVLRRDGGTLYRREVAPTA